MSPFKIAIVVEGNEEEAFFDIVKQVGTNTCFDLKIENAHGFGNIPDLFLSILREEGAFDCVLCIYDVDNRAKEKDSPYAWVRKKLISLFGDEFIVDSFSFCSNPNILQYFLLAADALENVALKSTSKKANTSLIHKYWPQIGNVKLDSSKKNAGAYYDAAAWQLDIFKSSIIYETYSYNNLLVNSSFLSTDYKNDLPAGNLFPLLLALRDGDEEFFKKIQSHIEEFGLS